jgi:hypothetical protein
MVLARIIEPASKLDSARVLEEAGVVAASYPTVNQRLRVYAGDSWRQKLSAACAARAGLGPASLVLYDVSTLYCETDAGDGFWESGFSKERRLEPQITIGLLTDSTGFPLMVHAFEGNKAETTTIVRAFQAAHRLPDVTVVADAGMVSAGNQKAIEDAGLSFILGARIADVPYLVKTWRDKHPGEQIPDGQIFTQPWPAGPAGQRSPCSAPKGTAIPPTPATARSPTSSGPHQATRPSNDSAGRPAARRAAGRARDLDRDQHQRHVRQCSPVTKRRAGPAHDAAPVTNPGECRQASKRMARSVVVLMPAVDEARQHKSQSMTAV